MVALPLFKLGVLVVKQVSKPIANLVKTGARNSSIFKKIISSPAQRYNRLEQRFRMRQMGYQGDVNVKPLTETAAVDLAANILGEIVVFSIAVMLLFVEMKRSQLKEQSKEDTQNAKLVSLQGQINDIGIEIEKQSAQIRELTRRG
eukprot:Seg9474.2 transcript_id=Seg9474.2/GoldUCD/mRNA.D3Y31 product="putative OPA3-like protein" protein_id=Seg9474.2/GoldUCD/D3Y31